ncbi:hypothetical protein BS17DRAFT_781329 [Gyrodon lividus]|nr:hypothetical protein BS17DRAFT_781329 [Gyrodon lividus]
MATIPHEGDLRISPVPQPITNGNLDALESSEFNHEVPAVLGEDSLNRLTKNGATPVEGAGVVETLTLHETSVNGDSTIVGMSNGIETTEDELPTRDLVDVVSKPLDIPSGDSQKEEFVHVDSAVVLVTETSEESKDEVVEDAPSASGALQATAENDIDTENPPAEDAIGAIPNPEIEQSIDEPQTVDAQDVQAPGSQLEHEISPRAAEEPGPVDEVPSPTDALALDINLTAGAIGLTKSGVQEATSACEDTGVSEAVPSPLGDSGEVLSGETMDEVVGGPVAPFPAQLEEVVVVEAEEKFAELETPVAEAETMEVPVIEPASEAEAVPVAEETLIVAKEEAAAEPEPIANKEVAVSEESVAVVEADIVEFIVPQTVELEGIREVEMEELLAVVEPSHADPVVESIVELAVEAEVSVTEVTVEDELVVEEAPYTESILVDAGEPSDASALGAIPVKVDDLSPPVPEEIINAEEPAIVAEVETVEPLMQADEVEQVVEVEVLKAEPETLPIVVEPSDDHAVVTEEPVTQADEVEQVVEVEVLGAEPEMLLEPSRDEAVTVEELAVVTEVETVEPITQAVEVEVLGAEPEMLPTTVRPSYDDAIVTEEPADIAEVEIVESVTQVVQVEVPGAEPETFLEPSHDEAVIAEEPTIVLEVETIEPVAQASQVEQVVEVEVPGAELELLSTVVEPSHIDSVGAEAPAAAAEATAGPSAEELAPTAQAEITITEAQLVETEEYTEVEPTLANESAEEGSVLEEAAPVEIVANAIEQCATEDVVSEASPAANQEPPTVESAHEVAEITEVAVVAEETPVVELPVEEATVDVIVVEELLVTIQEPSPAESTEDVTKAELIVAEESPVVEELALAEGVPVGAVEELLVPTEIADAPVEIPKVVELVLEIPPPEAQELAVAAEAGVSVEIPVAQLEATEVTEIKTEPAAVGESLTEVEAEQIGEVEAAIFEAPAEPELAFIEEPTLPADVVIAVESPTPGSSILEEPKVAHVVPVTEESPASTSEPTKSVGETEEEIVEFGSFIPAEEAAVIEQQIVSSTPPAQEEVIQEEPDEPVELGSFIPPGFEPVALEQVDQTPPVIAEPEEDDGDGIEHGSFIASDAEAPETLQLVVETDIETLTPTDTTPLERPKSPWTPSYSVTQQGPRESQVAGEETELGLLEQFPEPVATPAPEPTVDVAMAPVEDVAAEVVEAAPVQEAEAIVDETMVPAEPEEVIQVELGSFIPSGSELAKEVENTPASILPAAEELGEDSEEDVRIKLRSFVPASSEPVVEEVIPMPLATDPSAAEVVEEADEVIERGSFIVEFEPALEVMTDSLTPTESATPERPKSPWTPSYSVTKQGPGELIDEEELDHLDQLPELFTATITDSAAETTTSFGGSTQEFAESIVEAVIPVVLVTEIQASIDKSVHVSTDTSESTVLVSEDVPPATPVKIEVAVFDKLQTFPQETPLEPQKVAKKPSLSAIDENAACDRPESGALHIEIPTSPLRRTRVESTTSSRFFPGGWFSSSPKVPEEGRTSLEVAAGEFVSKTVGSTPSTALPSAVEEDKEKKSRWCTIM